MPVIVGVILVHLMFLLVAGLGLLCLWSGVEMMWTGREPLSTAAIVVAMGVVFSAIGLGFFYLRFLRRPVVAAREARLKALYPDQPWMLRDDWRAGRLVHTNPGAMLFMWIWTVGWWSAIALVGRLNYDKIVEAVRESWTNIFVGVIFIGAGLLGLMFAVRLTRAHLRYGNTHLAIDTLPGYLGERFRGAVTAGLPKPPLNPLEAELRCELRTDKRRRVSGKTETSIESTDLWKTSERISPGKLLHTGARVRIPVAFDLPADQPETDLNGGVGICWTLRVSTTGKGDEPFSCSFEVPVYRRR